MTPDSVLRSIPLCNGEFSYNGDEPGRIKLRIRYNNEAPEDWDGKPSSNSTWTYPQWVYDFDNEERIDDVDNDDDDSEYEDLDGFTIVLDDETPAEDDEVTLEIEAIDSNEDVITDYEGNDAEITIEYRASPTSSRYNATSTQVAIDDETPNFEYGFAETDITFKESYEYRVTVTDDNENVDDYETFEVGDYEGVGYGDIEELAFTNVSPTDPDEDEWVDVTIEAWDSDEDIVEDYENTVKFKVEVRDDTNNERETASTSDYELDTTTYTFDEDDNGEHDFTNLVQFNDDTEDYRLVVYDDDDSSIDEGYKVFDFGNGYDEDDDDEGTAGDTDSFYLTTYDTTPEVNNRASLTVTARDGNTKDTSYRGTILFEIYYKSPSASTWTKTTSSTYYDINDDYEDNEYTFRSADNGVFEEVYFIKFKKEDYQYKIVVVDEDDDDIDGEKTFTVGEGDSTTNGDTDNFYLTTDDSTPTTSQEVDLTVKARDGTTTDTSYRGTVQFEVYYKASGSYTWVKTTSSTYYEMDSDYEDDGYTFTSSNNGTKVFSNFIKFKKNNYSYKVIVYDEDDEDIEGYKTFTVGTVSNDSDVDGFTDSELRTLGAIYEARPDAINRLEDRYPNLEDSSRRQSMADDIYDEMELVLDDDDDREYKDFMDFYNTFLDRYRYTVSVR
jgi:hypothetical protein